jgi:hypothetical protein
MTDQKARDAQAQAIIMDKLIQSGEHQRYMTSVQQPGSMSVMNDVVVVVVGKVEGVVKSASH